MFGEERNETVGGGLFVGHGDERPEIEDLLVRHILHVVFKILRVGDDDGAVEVVLGGAGFLVFIEYTGMEDGADPAVDQPLNMPVRELGGIALGFRGNGVHTAFIEFPG